MCSLVPKWTACGMIVATVWTSGCCSVAWTSSATIAAADPSPYAGVTIIFVETPRDICSISGSAKVSDHFNACGINSIYFDPLLDRYDGSGLAELVCQVKRDLGHRVLLVGWSLGGAVALDGIDVLASQGMDVDTCVILDLYNLNVHRGLRVHPPNVRRMVVARSEMFGFPSGFNNPATYVIRTWNHMAVPTHPDTMELLFTEAALLSSVPPAVGTTSTSH